ncbi:MAG TPA: hypothetical protein VHC96_08115 [Puia sp.]|nr:hypothetical protein [Puia sp.]
MGRKINELLRKNVLHQSPEDHRSYAPGFCMPIQLMPKQGTLKLGAPEGIRVFVQQDDKVLAAVDFMYHGPQLKLNTVHQGSGVRSMLVILNKLEKRYMRYPGACRPELIYFLLGNSPYFKVTAGKEIRYFHQPKEKLLAVTAEQLLRNISSIIKHHQS